MGVWRLISAAGRQDVVLIFVGHESAGNLDLSAVG